VSFNILFLLASVCHYPEGKGIKAQLPITRDVVILWPSESGVILRSGQIFLAEGKWNRHDSEKNQQRTSWKLTHETLLETLVHVHPANCAGQYTQ
jgi:hypothetical protein